jgi:hypothetical protein
MLAQVWARHGRSSRLRLVEGCVPGSALFLVACKQLRQGCLAANRCDRRGPGCSKSAMPSGKPSARSGTVKTATPDRHRQKEASFS